MAVRTWPAVPLRWLRSGAWLSDLHVYTSVPAHAPLPSYQCACSWSPSLQDSEHKVYYHYLVQDTPGGAGGQQSRLPPPPG